jgi:hypothetical protein
MRAMLSSQQLAAGALLARASLSHGLPNEEFWEDCLEELRRKSGAHPRINSMGSGMGSS